MSQVTTGLPPAMPILFREVRRVGRGTVRPSAAVGAGAHRGAMLYDEP